MRYILIISLLTLGTFSTQANTHKKHSRMNKKMDSMTFEDAKKWKMDKLSHKKNMIEEEESCIGQAKDKAGLKKCSDAEFFWIVDQWT
jgi:hypothetical protein